MREMEKALLVATSIYALLISMIVGMQVVNVAKANFMPFPPAPSTDPPIVSFQLSEKQIPIYSDQLNFTLLKPDSWRTDWVAGEILSIIYSKDQQLFSIDVGSRKIDTGGLVYTIDNLEKTSQHSINLAGLTNGQHTIELNITSVTYYNPKEDYWNIHKYHMIVLEEILVTTTTANGNISYVIDSVAEQTYPGKTPPVISILSLNNNFFGLITPLNFTIDETTSWMSYSLDGQANVTIAGNSTLTGLADGSHNLVVYANDTIGNMGKSDTVTFTINTQPSPSPSPTPTLSPSPSIPEFPSWIVLIFMIAVSVSLAVLKAKKLGVKTRIRP